MQLHGLIIDKELERLGHESAWNWNTAPCPESG